MQSSSDDTPELDAPAAVPGRTVLPGRVRIIITDDWKEVPRIALCSPDLTSLEQRDHGRLALRIALKAPEVQKLITRGCILGALPEEFAEEFKDFLADDGLKFTNEVFKCFRMVAPEQQKTWSIDGVEIVALGPEDERLAWISKQNGRPIELLRFYAREMPVPPLLALEAGKPIGCCVLDSDDFAFGGLFVEPENRGRGIAPALLVERARRAREAGWRATCHVVEGNERSQRAQAKAGWERDGLGMLVWFEFACSTGSIAVSSA